ncbi:hypothetical protein BpHYR1_001035 [Brachionus plicatilis]|uniref:Uncharacterized protein n=1 Tax=Brachionus plicatilis TaxID=10195 RepID=A0A3M7QCM0_BRAPC|nr:hypothetical protein BpHYR1_001035 [Brachionus plicatilis]
MNRPFFGRLHGRPRSRPFFFLAGHVASRPAPNTNVHLTVHLILTFCDTLESLYELTYFVSKTVRLFDQQVHLGIVQLFARGQKRYVQRVPKSVQQIQNLNQQLSNLIELLIFVHVLEAYLKANLDQTAERAHGRPDIGQHLLVVHKRRADHSLGRVHKLSASHRHIIQVLFEAPSEHLIANLSVTNGRLAAHHRAQSYMLDGRVQLRGHTLQVGVHPAESVGVATLFSAVRRNFLQLSHSVGHLGLELGAHFVQRLQVKLLYVAVRSLYFPAGFFVDYDLGRRAVQLEVRALNAFVALRVQLVLKVTVNVVDALVLFVVVHFLDEYVRYFDRVLPSDLEAGLARRRVFEHALLDSGRAQYGHRHLGLQLLLLVFSGRIVAGHLQLFFVHADAQIVQAQVLVGLGAAKQVEQRAKISGRQAVVQRRVGGGRFAAQLALYGLVGEGAFALAFFDRGVQIVVAVDGLEFVELVSLGLVLDKSADHFVQAVHGLGLFGVVAHTL